MNICKNPALWGWTGWHQGFDPQPCHGLVCSTNFGTSHPTHISRQILPRNQHLFAARVQFIRGRDILYYGLSWKNSKADRACTCWQTQFWSKIPSLLQSPIFALVFIGRWPYNVLAYLSPRHIEATLHEVEALKPPCMKINCTVFCLKLQGLPKYVF